VYSTWNDAHLANDVPLSNTEVVRVWVRMDLSVVDLPFNKFVGIERATTGAHLLLLPSGGQYLNHLGTVHASALLALAEASSGEFLLRHFGSVEGILPVVRRLEAKFRKPAHGAITSTVKTPAEALSALEADLGSKGRTLISIQVDVHDESGTHVLSAEVEWFISRISSST
jgi:acyl-coenzyme A thioesterase PaaI-like protein